MMPETFRLCNPALAQKFYRLGFGGSLALANQAAEEAFPPSIDSTPSVYRNVRVSH